MRSRERQPNVDKWDKAPSPGQFGRQVVERLTGRELPDRWARSSTNLVHWLTGAGWAAQFWAPKRLVRASLRRVCVAIGPYGLTVQLRDPPDS
jgi:hypothetical protein